MNAFRELADCSTFLEGSQCASRLWHQFLSFRTFVVFGTEGELLACCGPHEVSPHYRAPTAFSDAPDPWPNDRPVADEVEAVGLALPGLGTLYVGRLRPEWSESELSLMRVLGGQTALGLSWLRRLEWEGQARDLAARKVRELETRLLQLGDLQPAIQAIHQAPDAPTVLEALHTGLARLPHDLVAVYFPDTEELPEVARNAYAHQHPLLYETPSMLVIPFDTGVVVVESAKPQAYTREDRDYAWSLVLGAASALTRVRLASQLSDSRKLAALGRLSAGVAHELNTPLAAVQLTLDSLKRSADGSAAARLEKADRALKKAAALIEGLLGYSRRSPPPRRRVAFSELAPNLEPDCLVWGNPDELRQVVENILQNAREAASENYTTRLNHRGSEVTLEVSDWGPGIPPEVEGLIFDPFFTTKPVGRGPGLGLWQARELARQHGGDLVLASPAQPTTFLLRLPAIGSFPDCAAEPTA